MFWFPGLCGRKHLVSLEVHHHPATHGMALLNTSVCLDHQNNSIVEGRSCDDENCTTDCPFVPSQKPESLHYVHVQNYLLEKKKHVNKEDTGVTLILKQCSPLVTCPVATWAYSGLCFTSMSVFCYGYNVCKHWHYGRKISLTIQ